MRRKRKSKFLMSLMAPLQHGARFSVHIPPNNIMVTVNITAACPTPPECLTVRPESYLK